MRLAVWILLVLNVALLAYFNLDKPAPVPQGAHAQLHPEKIKLLTTAEIAKLPKKPAAAPAPAIQYSCYEWGSFSTDNLSRAQEALGSFGLSATVQQQNVQEATRYWVYIPRHANLQAAQTALDELHSLGIQDSYIVLEPQWRYAISLGVFKDEQLATKLLEEVRGRGATSAVKGVRNQEKGQASLLISNMSTDMAAELEKLKPSFPGSELKQVTCQ